MGATEDTALEDKTLCARDIVASCDWYVADLDSTAGDTWCHADLGYGEWGYFNLVEAEALLIHKFVVLDRELGFTPISAAQLGIA